MRILRIFYSIARTCHFCNHCCEYILPGELYEGMVQVMGRHLVVFKTHANGCDFPPDPRDEEKEKDSEVELSLAA